MLATSKSSVAVRSATPEDISQIHAIYSHYISHTPTDMHHTPPDLVSFTADYESLVSRDLPYLVAVPSPGLNIQECSEKTDTTNNYIQDQRQDAGRILGFIHGSPFRGHKVGYSHTAELTIICDPHAIKRGVGGALMKAFVVALQDGGMIQQLLAFMTVLEDEREDERVKKFYEKWQFTEAGKLVDVGEKFGRKFSKRWMQRSILLGE